MSIKRKLILIGICIGIVIVVFTVNVVRRMNEDKKEEQEQTIVSEDIITRAEAYRLISYLDYNRTERESLTIGITYTEEEMSGWYDSFVNAVWKMGLIESKISIAPMEALTYGACKELVDHLIVKNPEYQVVYSGISFDFSKPDEEMLVREFLELYEAVLATSSMEELKLKKETLFVLGSETSEDGTNRMITDLGKYYYQNAKGYEVYYKQLQQQNSDNTTQEGTVTSITGSETDEDGSEDNNINEAAQDKNAEDAAKDEAESDTREDNVTVEEKASTKQLDFVEQYLDKGIKALVCDQEIIYVSEEMLEKIVLHNVWIEKGEGLQVNTFINGVNKNFTAMYKLSTAIEKVIGDITIENQKIIKILQKPDVIQGKVLQAGEDYIEIEGYGKVPLEDDYKIYKLYGKISMEPTSSILVGYENTDFVVSLGKISAALITEGIKAENIRVLLRTSSYKDVYHEKVELTATSDFTISNKEMERSYSAGDIVTIDQQDELLAEGRITVKSNEEDGKIQILSIERSDGYPKYRGSIEIAEGDQGLLVVNELPLEEYLYAVIPSEMPTYYGLESLRVQAVCARSYAYKHLLANSLNLYGAHVDDSVSYQVYNNISENEDSILAVKDTYGKVIKYNGEVITAYYFSTSCGHTAGAANVWSSNADYPYLQGKLLFTSGEEEGADIQSELEVQYEDLSTEENFRSFIETQEVTTYDSSFNWYRWKVTMKIKEIAKVIDQKLAERYNANPELLLTKTGIDDKGEAAFESIPVDTVGNIVDISVRKRENSGIISELLITGSKNTILVKTEYNIRALLAPTYDTVIRQDESEVENLNLLPSAFFTIDKKEKSGELSSISLSGGGYGHGVGMSQNGVKALADAGEGYEEIVAYFYEGTDLGFIYE